MHYTTSCNTQSGAPEDGRNHRPKHVELIGIINKLLLLHLVGVYIIYINDARSSKYQILMEHSSIITQASVAERRCNSSVEAQLIGLLQRA